MPTDKCNSHQAHEEHFIRNDARLGEQDDELDRVSRCLERLTVLYERSEKWQESADARLVQLEHAPARKWDQAMGYAVAALISAIVGYMAGNIGF